MCAKALTTGLISVPARFILPPAFRLYPVFPSSAIDFSGFMHDCVSPNPVALGNRADHSIARGFTVNRGTIAEGLMIWRNNSLAWGVALVALGASAAPCLAQQQQPAAVTGVEQVIGLTGIKDHAKGTLSIENGSLQFTHSKDKATVAATSMQDIVTGNDSQRAIHGALGTLTMFGPYGSGRFLSLFRTKLDTLTIQYSDSAGAVHGAIFTVPVGKAEVLKKQLLDLGAHTTIPLVDDSKAPDAKNAPAKESKP